jgi:hypothetical protein
MDRQVPHLESDASLRVMLPILGLLGGLGLGALRAWLAGAAEIGAVALVVSGGIIGSALGMSAVLLCAYRLGQARIRSLKSFALLVLVLVAALALWFALTMLATVFTSDIA